MAPKMTLRTYEDYERSRGDLSGMFSVLTDAFAIDRVLYPGSYVHLSPSFVFPRVVYIDTDRRAKVYFADSLGVEALVEERKHYVEPPQITFHNVDYTTNLDEPDEGFDLLVSLYAGFVSEACKRYLRVGG